MLPTLLPFNRIGLAHLRKASGLKPFEVRQLMRLDLPGRRLTAMPPPPDPVETDPPVWSEDALAVWTREALGQAGCPPRVKQILRSPRWQTLVVHLTVGQQLYRRLHDGKYTAFGK